MQELIKNQHRLSLKNKHPKQGICIITTTANNLKHRQKWMDYCSHGSYIFFLKNVDKVVKLVAFILITFS